MRLDPTGAVLLPTSLVGIDLTRALKAFVREEFDAPVAAIAGLIDLLIEDADALGGGTYLPDLERMRAAAERMSGIITAFVEGLRPEDDTPVRLRHDLRTPVTAIIGYGELLIEEMRDGEETALLAGLADVMEAAGRLLTLIERLVEYAGDATAASGPAEPVILRQAAEIVRRLVVATPTSSRKVTGRILVVDDNDAMLTLTARRLERDGHEVATCNGGHDALARLAAERFDLVLADVLMPGMSGLELLGHIKERPETAALPVIMVSGLDDLDTVGRCIDAGADDYLAKPPNPILLRARIGSSLERKFLRDSEHAATERLREERAHSDLLLRNVLPNSIVERLRAGEDVTADHFDEVTVLFCDLVGFTPLTSRMEPSETIDLLNEVFSGFDRLASEHGLEKIKTIGDAYMAVGGLPEPNPDHAFAVARAALGMPEVVARAGRRRSLGLAFRTGIDTGPAVAGIIGTQKFFYDVWGDAVNTASRMERYGEPGRIHLSGAARRALGDRALCTPRGNVAVKGKGVMNTFFLEALSPVA